MNEVWLDRVQMVEVGASTPEEGDGNGNGGGGVGEGGVGGESWPEPSEGPMGIGFVTSSSTGQFVFPLATPSATTTSMDPFGEASETEFPVV